MGKTTFWLLPAELLMGRPISSNIPQPAKTFIPQWPYETSGSQIRSLKKNRRKTMIADMEQGHSLPYPTTHQSGSLHLTIMATDIERER